MCLVLQQIMEEIELEGEADRVEISDDPLGLHLFQVLFRGQAMLTAGQADALPGRSYTDLAVREQRPDGTTAAWHCLEAGIIREANQVPFGERYDTRRMYEIRGESVGRFETEPTDVEEP